MDKKVKIKCTKATAIRTALLIVALVNNCLMLFGYSVLPFSEEVITQFVSAAFTGVVSLMTWWKNNSFTEAAHKADNQLKEQKKAKKIKAE